MHSSLLQIHHANAVEQQRSAVRRPWWHFATPVDSRSARRHTPQAHLAPVARTA
jgi:hypothetical protein